MRFDQKENSWFLVRNTLACEITFIEFGFSKKINFAYYEKLICFFFYLRLSSFS